VRPNWGVVTDLQPLDAQLTQLARGVEAQAAAENFPVALRLLPVQPRRQLTDVYRYARFVDDVGDEASGDRLRLLDAVERDVRGLLDGTATLPAVRPLAPLVRAGTLPLQPLLDLIDANRMDQEIGRYPTFDDLLGYCALSAAPVGRIVLHLAGAASEANVADSDAVCDALQVLEHCQDVAEDAAAGRVYLPAEDLARHHADRAALRPGPTPAPVRAVVALQVDRALRLLTAGRPLVHRLHGWARIAVAGYVAGGFATAHALRRSGYDVLARDVRPSRVATAFSAARLLAGRAR
jgi:squalene synthase HpnC